MDRLRSTAGILIVTAFVVFLPGSAPLSARERILLPVEIAGEAGTTVSVTPYVPPGLGRQVRALWMQVHGLEYAGMASVRVNQGPWRPLNNDTVSVAEPGKSCGGIGGGFATVKATMQLPENSVADGSNTIEFRFDRTDGVVSGFRVLAFNFVGADRRTILPPEAFTEEDPDTWTPPFNDPENISVGRNLWEGARLVANALPKAPFIHAHCSDCHAQNGRDLKYFNFSSVSIVNRSRFHGLSELQGRQIASYIRSLPGPNPGRPWNPPYQPGPGLDDRRVADWAAGAGLEWVLDDDIDTLPFVFAKGGPAGTFRPDSDLNPREIPIAFQLPDWNHWLPRVHPLDFREAKFRSSEFRRLFQTADYPKLIAAGGLPAFFDKWSRSRNVFLSPRPATGSAKWTPELAEAFYSAQLWQLVKTWEITWKFNLEEAGPAPRFWTNTIPAGAAPAESGIPNGTGGIGRSALVNEYFNNAWYEVQLLLNDGNHRHSGGLPLDWVYLAGHFLDLQRLSERSEPGRLLIAMGKAMQSTDPAIGPDNYSEGWRPERNIDPRIMVAREWAPVFRDIPDGLKRAITESLLSAWLDKTLQYPVASYFARGSRPASYKLPAQLLEITGGRVWDASPRFRAAGVRPVLVERLDVWGGAWTAVAELFHY
jgi:hypothetical protein